MDEMKQEQMCAIKNRLLNKFHESNLTIYRLLEEAKNISGFSLNYDTFRKTLDPNSTTLDIYSVLALCRYWNLDVSYILSSPDTKETPMPDVEKMELITFDPVHHTYIQLGKTVGNAFSDGKQFLDKPSGKAERK